MSSANVFSKYLLAQLDIGDRQAGVDVGGIAPGHIIVQYINLPKGIGGAGGGAEAMNNRLLLTVDGFHRSDIDAPAPGKVSVKMLSSSLPRDMKLRGKTAAPAVIAKYIADFLAKVAREVPPNYTHTKR